MTITHGNFVMQDSYNNPLLLEWVKVKGQSDELASKIKELSPLFIDTYVNTEMGFARTYPEAISTDFMLKPLSDLIKDHHTIDWGRFEQKLREHLTHFFMTMDWKAKSNPEDEHIFVVARDQREGHVIGALQFFSSPSFEAGSIKAALQGIKTEALERDIEKLLMGSIFKICSDIKCIFLHMRSTNKRAIEKYTGWGFVSKSNSKPYWTDMEYCVSNSNILQTSDKLTK